MSREDNLTRSGLYICLVLGTGPPAVAVLEAAAVVPGFEAAAVMPGGGAPPVLVLLFGAAEVQARCAGRVATAGGGATSAAGSCSN